MKKQEDSELEDLVKLDKIRNNRIKREKLWLKEAHQRAIDRLPNEFRPKERDYNPFNDRNQDSYCKLYAEE